MDEETKSALFGCLDGGHEHRTMEEADACDEREAAEDRAAHPLDFAEPPWGWES